MTPPQDVKETVTSRLTSLDKHRGEPMLIIARRQIPIRRGASQSDSGPVIVVTTYRLGLIAPMGALGFEEGVVLLPLSRAVETCDDAQTILAWKNTELIVTDFVLANETIVVPIAKDGAVEMEQRPCVEFVVGSAAIREWLAKDISKPELLIVELLARGLGCSFASSPKVAEVINEKISAFAFALVDFIFCETGDRQMEARQCLGGLNRFDVVSDNDVITACLQPTIARLREKLKQLRL